MSEQALDRLAALLREEGGLMATLVDLGAYAERDDDPATASPARMAAAGPRAEGRREEYELLVEAIYEGYLLHYGTPRVVRPAEADLGLLAGDRLYAIGLSRLVALEDAITLSALAHAQGEQALADAVWEAGARAVGWGSNVAHGRAKELVLAGATKAIEAMRTSVAGFPPPL
jgi:hypothetical protein